MDVEAINVQELLNQAALLQKDDQNDSAINLYERVLRIDPNNVTALANMAVIYHKLKQSDTALDYLEKAMVLDDSEPHYYYLEGSILSYLKRYQRASEAFEKFIKKIPNHPEALARLGYCYECDEQFKKALDCYDRSFQQRPDPEVAKRAAKIYYEANHPRAAIKVLEKAFKIDSSSLSTLDLLVKSYLSLGDEEPKYYINAMKYCWEGIKRQPNHPLLCLRYNLLKLKLCDWDRHEHCLEVYEETVKWLMENNYHLEAPPWHLQCSPLPYDLVMAGINYHVAQEYKDVLQNEKFKVYQFSKASNPNQRLKIAYLSSSIHDHPMAHLIHRLFENHDKSKFEVFLYSVGVQSDSCYRKHIQATVEHFIDVQGKRFDKIADQMHQDGIDILIDLHGFTDAMDPRISMMRPAPIQISYLGHPGSQGAAYTDYMVVDHETAPPEISDHFVEKCIFMPYTYMYTDPNPIQTDKEITRESCGLPVDQFIFCSFNNAYKMGPTIFDLWIDILKQVPNSVFWIMIRNTIQKENIIGYAEKRGLDTARLIFTEGCDKAEHLARLKCADIFLDARVVNAHTTAVDALWAGLPILTLEGDRFGQRVCASILKAHGMPELVTHSLEEYKALAIKLATNPEQLAALKAKILANKETQPLFNIEQQTRYLEKGYELAWQRFQQGLKPESIEVPA